ncbi:protein kinase domain-containing protein [Mycobacterium rhizamassiliense]|uniref:protein kinase domain-containing protein n=1 Tax=Mycobacterium rhizamassiliense TaxID=1841860 RepID=UPI00097D0900|nr:protein kinase [Mycobacterium rhizamassiliense]
MATDSFGHYELRELLGRGGMGQVFRAYDSATDRIVALKVLPPHMAEDDEFQQRFRREARIAASLNDPHVVPIHSYGEIDGRLYVDMRLIEGRDLDHYIAENGGRLSAERAVAVIEQVAAALDTAREEGLIHRDVKPSNILVTKARDFVYLIDFGIARAAADTALTHTGHTMGTVAYMAPERFRGATDHRADVYSLACVLYECLAGTRPYPGDSFEEQLNGHLNTPVPRPSLVAPGIPPAFDDVVARGMAKDPDQRYQTAIEFADAARAALPGAGYASAPGTAPYAAVTPAATPTPPSTPAPARQTPPQPSSNRRQAIAVIGGAVFALVAVIVLVVAITTKDDSPASNTTSSTATRARTPKFGAPPPPPSPGESTPAAAVGPLPAFAPPPGLGADCQYSLSPEGAAKQANLPPSGRVSTTPPVINATVSTNFGDLVIHLFNAKSPCAVNSFVSLAQQQFFNSTTCARMVRAQEVSASILCGGPAPDGTGGPGYEFADEYPVNQYAPNDPALRVGVDYPRGTVIQANNGPNTNDSQFSIMFIDIEATPTNTVLGAVDPLSFPVLDKISAVGVAGHRESGLPAQPVNINSVRIG